MKHLATQLVVGLLVAVSAPAMAAQCHYFWTTDCFEIRDARTRDITHHVLLSSRPYDAGEAEAGQCPALVESQIDDEHRERVLKRFNKVLRRLDGCEQVESLTPRVFEDGVSATEEWRRLHQERNFKLPHIIRRLPED